MQSEVCVYACDCAELLGNLQQLFKPAARVMPQGTFTKKTQVTALGQKSESQLNNTLVLPAAFTTTYHSCMD